MGRSKYEDSLSEPVWLNLVLRGVDKMAEIVKAIDIAVPVEVAFDFVANPHNGLKFMPNFTKFQPVGGLDHGKGAKVEAAGTMFGVQYRTTLEIIDFVQNERFVSRSTEG